MPSSAQAVATVQVFDYITTTGSGTSSANAAGLAGVTVVATLNYSQASYQSPVVQVPPLQIRSTTDQYGYWTMYLVANDKLNPTGTTYTIQIPGYAPYDINVISTVVPVGGWQSTAIVVNTPSSLGSNGFYIPGGATVQGALTTGIALSVLGTPVASIRAANLQVGGATTGSGSFDSGTGSFNGNASGNVVGINAASTFAGRLLDVQLAGQTRVRASGLGGASLIVTPRPTTAGGDLGLLVDTNTDPGGLSAVTTSFRVKAGTLTFTTAANARLVQFDPPTYSSATPQTFSQVETLLVNGAPVAAGSATFTQSVGAKIVGGMVIDGTGSVGSVGDPIALNVGGGFMVFTPQITSPFGGDAGIGIAPADGVGITHSTRTLGIKNNTMNVTSAYDQQMHVLIQPQTITSTTPITMDSNASLWIQGPPLAAGSITQTNPWAVRIANGDLGMTGDVVFFGATAARIRGGSTSLDFRSFNNSNSNMLITDAGAITVRSTVSGVTTLNATTVAATTVTATTLTGTLSTAAQPSVTSLGTLTSLVTSGSATLGGALLSSLSGTPGTSGLNVGLSAATPTGNDTRGFVDITTTGSAPTANQKLYTFAFNSNARYASAPSVQLTNGSQGANATGALGTAAWVGEYGLQNITTTGFDVYLNNGAMPNSATLRMHYLIVG